MIRHAIKISTRLNFNSRDVIWHAMGCRLENSASAITTPRLPRTATAPTLKHVSHFCKFSLRDPDITHKQHLECEIKI